MSAKCQKPAENCYAERDKSENPLPTPGKRGAFVQVKCSQQTEGNATGETEKVSADIGVFSTDAEKGEQGERCGKWDWPAVT